MKLTKYLGKFFKHCIDNYCNKDVETQVPVNVPGRVLGDFDRDKGINLKFYNASGGTLIVARSYDPRTDRSNENLYIVREEDDLPQEISKVLMIESLR